MIDDGWVKNYRKIKDWEWYKKPLIAHLFQHLIREANHKDQKWQGVLVKRGQLIAGRSSLAMETGLSEQNIRTCLDKLKNSGELTIKSTNKYSVVTICNYDKYQNPEELINQLPNQQLTSNQPATNHKQECKELKNTHTHSELPEWMPEKLWSEFLDHRVSVRAKISKKSYGRFFNKFEKLKKMGYEPEFVVDTLVDKGWRWFNPEWLKNGKPADSVVNDPDTPQWVRDSLNGHKKSTEREG